MLYSPYRQHTSDIKRENQTSEDASVLGRRRRHAGHPRYRVVDGRFFTAGEEHSRPYVAVIGQTVRDTLFPGDASPLGGIVRIEGIEFIVVGVLEQARFLLRKGSG